MLKILKKILAHPTWAGIGVILALYFSLYNSEIEQKNITYHQQTFGDNSNIINKEK